MVLWGKESLIIKGYRTDGWGKNKNWSTYNSINGDWERCDKSLNVKAPQKKGNRLAEGGDKEGRHGTTGNVAWQTEWLDDGGDSQGKLWKFHQSGPLRWVWTKQ